MKVRAIIKLIEADGWYRVKARGGHRQYKHPTKPGRVTIPGQMNADLDQKTEKSILKQAGLQDNRNPPEDLMETYLIVIGRTPTGYSGHCPDVLGCASAGKTVEAVVANMKQALELHFEGMVEDGDPIPKPRGLDSYREVMKDLDLDEYFLAHVQIDTSRYAAPMSHP